MIPIVIFLARVIALLETGLTTVALALLTYKKSFIEMALNNHEDFILIINATGHATVEMVKYYDTRDTLKNNAAHGMAKYI